MPTDKITFQNSGYFSKLMVDYLNQEPKLRSLYHRFPLLENFEAQIAEKSQNYAQETRDVLQQAVAKQHEGLSISKLTAANIRALGSAQTFTVTTGHQLNLFTGPLYFLYKIISTIKLAERLQQRYPAQQFVPIYWMATEDHDFEEINHFQFDDKIIHWQKDAKGPVGRLSTEGLKEVCQAFQAQLGVGLHATYLKELFHEAYTQHSTLTAATKYLANALFGEYGLVLVDGDDKALKELLIPAIKEELLQQSAIQAVEKSFPILQDYSIQVNPREINLFYIDTNLRERILLEKDTYRVNHTSIQWTKEELLTTVERYPERFSPNVILRPLYQEIILPNLCYIGGGGELAYWLELKEVFALHKVTFPMLLLRNSALLATEKQVAKIDRLGLQWRDLFMTQNELIERQTKARSTLTFDFTQQRRFLEEQFESLEQIVKQTDASFSGAVQAQKAKQLKGLDNLEKRLLKAEKKKHAEELQRIVRVQNELFPNQSLQERQQNFSVFYTSYGPALCDALFKSLDPLSHEFDIITL